MTFVGSDRAARPETFARIEAFYDAVPRDGAVAEDIGGLVLFVRDGAGWPFYARPRLDATEPASAGDIADVRARQRELGAPEVLEWVHEVNPDLLAVARSAGLAVLQAPLMVLDPEALPERPHLPSGASVRLLDPTADTFGAELAASRAVAEVSFGAPGTVAGNAGPAERDAALPPLTPEHVAGERRSAAEHRRVVAVAERPGQGIVSSGMVQRVDDVAEIAGVATLPAARRRGLGGALTAALARHARSHGADLVLLSAGSDDIARVYAGVGFRRIGTACIA
ncbi:MAG TPA: GNAT family N-acetyltransferase, partial [Pilimelia sp.]|nr:GNAT family N-acetyltransferase [Pilimelia sp.]